MAAREAAQEEVAGTEPVSNVEILSYNVEEAAAALGAGVNSTRRLIREGRLVSFRIGRNIRVPKRAVADFIEREAFGLEPAVERRR